MDTPPLLNLRRTLWTRSHSRVSFDSNVVLRRSSCCGGVGERTMRPPTALLLRWFCRNAISFTPAGTMKHACQHRGAIDARNIIVNERCRSSRLPNAIARIHAVLFISNIGSRLNRNGRCNGNNNGHRNAQGNSRARGARSLVATFVRSVPTATGPRRSRHNYCVVTTAAAGPSMTT